MLEVSFYGIDEGEDTRIGSLRWDGKEFTKFPSNSLLLENILKEEIGDPFKRVRYSSEKNPEEWMEALHKKYRSAYLRATKPKKM